MTPANARPSADAESYGAMHFDDGVISDLSRRAALSTDGLAALTGGLLEGLRPGRHPGVSVTRDERGLTIEIRAAVTYGTDCVRLFEELRRRVTSRVREATGQQVSEVNLHVTGVREPGSEDDPEESAYIDF